jgi:hypothetical protein
MYLFLLGLVDDLDDLVDDRGIRQLQHAVSQVHHPATAASSHTNRMEETYRTYRRDIAELVLLSRQDLTHDATHDLAGPRLGQIRNNEDGLGCGKRTNRLAHLRDQVLLHLVT